MPPPQGHGWHPVQHVLRVFFVEVGEFIGTPADIGLRRGAQALKPDLCSRSFALSTLVEPPT